MTDSLTHKQTLRRLDELGYFWHVTGSHIPWSELKKIDAESVTFRDALTAYQKMMLLEPDGRYGSRTQKSLRFDQDADGNRRMCGCPDYVEAAGFGVVELAKIPNGTHTWPNPEMPIVLVRNFSAVPGLTAHQTKDGFDRAVADINSKIGVTLQWSNDWNSADVQIRLNNLTGGTLALAALSVGNRRPGRWRHYQEYDESNRTWSVDMLQGVSAHELGHTLGFSHSRDPDDLMFPTWNPGKKVWEAGDVRRGLAAYPRIHDPQPEPPPTPGDDTFEMMFMFGDRTIRATGTAKEV